MLRSSLFIAIVSLFVLTGYARDVFGECRAHHAEARTEHGGKTSGKPDDCQCLCHQIISPLTPEPVGAVAAVQLPETFLAHPDEFPPDAVPRGIDVPPQLA